MRRELARRGPAKASYCLLGLESATISDGKVENPERTIPRATMLGTLFTALICVVARRTVLILLPTRQLASSNAPFADVARMFWGGTGAGSSASPRQG